MPRPTTASPPLPRPPRARSPELAGPLTGAALYAALELGGALALLGFFHLGRAEALLFLALRPWLLILAAASVAGWSWRRRAVLYGLALALVAGSETILLLGLGAEDPLEEMLRGFAAGALLALFADAVVQLLRRWRRAAGSLVAAILLLGLAASGLGLKPYEALVLGPTAPREVGGAKPPLLLMTSLPIVWGVGGAFDPNARPAESYRALQREFEVIPVDAIEPPVLERHRLMLLAHPRLLAPEELVALDAWVRAGGRLLVLTDPSFVSAREFPLLDARRPPDAGLLGPLLDHWGLRLEEGSSGWTETRLASGEERRKLATLGAGRFDLSGNSCRIAGDGRLARCRIGQGRAILVADADLLMDVAWTAPGNPRGGERHLRTADNLLLVAGWLDQLAGRSRARSDRTVQWIAEDADRGASILFASLPIAIALALGLGLLYGRRRTPTDLSTGVSTENN